ncbi:MAG TPA: hypothetical protein VMM78_04665 [Thermomicrobiales bacterium]|nr:hypothetical protein [Thermomicrobiales bacterium]
MRLFKRSTTSAPYEPKRTGPSQPGAYLFTLRSVPRHHDGVLTALESTGSARAYFSEPLAYLRGQGVSLFRVEATSLDFLENVYAWWRETEALEAFPFDIALYVSDRDFVASLRDHGPDEIRRMIEERAPRTPSDPEEFKRTQRLDG